VGTDALCDPGTRCDPPNDPPGAVTVEAVAVGTEEDRSLAALADGEVDRSGCAGRERDGDDLAALAQDGKRTVRQRSPHALGLALNLASECKKMTGHHR